jgi:hypothetical protein
MDVKKQPILLSLLSLLLVCLYPCLFQYTGNIPEAKLTDALLFFGIFLAVGLVLYLIALLLTRRAGGAGTLASLGMLVFMNIGLVTRGLKNYLPWLRARYLLLLSLVVGLALLVLLIRKKPRCFVPCLLLVLSFGTMSVMTLVLATPKLWAEVQEHQDQAELQDQTEAQEEQRTQVSEAAALPNVYYYLYDEYAGPECLEYFYGYDNSGFYEALEDRGFTCSGSSYNKESLATVRLVPDLYDLGYDVSPYFQSGDWEMPRLYQVFSQLGYRINLISHNDFLDTDGATSLITDQEADSICVYLYENSLLPSTPLASLLEQLPQLRASYQYESLLQETLDTMETAWQDAQEGPTLTLGYVQCPHSWFVYDGDGAPVSEEEHLNWEDPQYYLGQLEYTNKRILEAVDQIQKNDPTAIIILQSDHGARLASHLTELYDAPYDEATDTLPQQNILNCVYVPGKDLEIEGLSGINTLRTLLNQVYGMDYEMLPDPEMHYED